MDLKYEIDLILKYVRTNLSSIRSLLTRPDAAKAIYDKLKGECPRGELANLLAPLVMERAQGSIQESGLKQGLETIIKSQPGVDQELEYKRELEDEKGEVTNVLKTGAGWGTKDWDGGWFLPSGEVIRLSDKDYAHAPLATNYLRAHPDIADQVGTNHVYDGGYERLFNAGWIRFWVATDLFLETSASNWNQHNLHKVQTFMMGLDYNLNRVYIDYEPNHIVVRYDEFLQANKPSDLVRLNQAKSAKLKTAVLIPHTLSGFQDDQTNQRAAELFASYSAKFDTGKAIALTRRDLMRDNFNMLPAAPRPSRVPFALPSSTPPKRQKPEPGTQLFDEEELRFPTGMIQQAAPSPLRVYRGAAMDEGDFESNHGYIYFTTTPRYANNYAEGNEGANVRLAYLDINKLLDLRPFGKGKVPMAEMVQFLEERGIRNQGLTESAEMYPRTKEFVWRYFHRGHLKNELVAAGYDAVAWEEAKTPDYRGGAQSGEVYVVLSPSQVKPAFRTASTSTFKTWFAGSKAVDSQGNPQKYYHGTGEDFDTFYPGRGGLIFFSPFIHAAGEYAKSTAEAAALYGESKPPRTIPVYLKTLHPFDMDDDSHCAKIKDKLPPGLLTQIQRIKRQNHANYEELEAIGAAVLRAAGFDGAWVKENDETPIEARDLAVFDSNQIKSAITSNFDPTDNRITASDSPSPLRVKVTNPQVDAKFFRHWMENLYNSGAYRPLTSGSVQQGIRASDVLELPFYNVKIKDVAQVGSNLPEWDFCIQRVGDAGKLLREVGKNAGAKAVTWQEILARFPAQLQAEIKDERPSGDAEDVQELQGWTLNSPTPITKYLKELLQNQENVEIVSRASDEAIQVINKKWGLDIQPQFQRYDSKPERYQNYAGMNGETAAPSILVNGAILWGCGRFVAALMRGDKSLRVWDISNRSSHTAAAYELQSPDDSSDFNLTLESRFGNWEVNLVIKDGTYQGEVTIDSLDRPQHIRANNAREVEETLRDRIDWHYRLLKQDLQREITGGHRPKYTYHDLDLDNARMIQEMLRDVERYLGPEIPKPKYGPGIRASKQAPAPEHPNWPVQAHGKIAALFHDRGWINAKGEWIPVNGAVDMDGEPGEHEEHHDIVAEKYFKGGIDSAYNAGWIRVGMYGKEGYADMGGCNAMQFDTLWKHFAETQPKYIIFGYLVEGRLDLEDFLMCKNLADLKKAIKRTYMIASGQPTMGFNVNDSAAPFTDWILRGEKEIETRNSDSLRSHIGERVGIIRTGVGPATLVGYCTLGEPIIYRDNRDFRQDQSQHMVPEGPMWDVFPGMIKYGYPILDVEPCQPKAITSQGRVWRRLARIEN